jgi:hypothetical protein
MSLFKKLAPPGLGGKSSSQKPGGKQAGNAAGAQKAGGMMGNPMQAPMMAPMSGKAAKPSGSNKTFQQPAAPEPRQWANPASTQPYDPNP